MRTTATTLTFAALIAALSAVGGSPQAAVEGTRVVSGVPDPGSQEDVGPATQG
ncbi:hypothetical protein [Kineococcus esterisolvens]|uniref:hypothetical protein n=1 Tax=unclassified Kineococcus TaxID=2621656 RepID=UPI003D7E8959